jgi:hypothetical protein
MRHLISVVAIAVVLAACAGGETSREADSDDGEATDSTTTAPEAPGTTSTESADDGNSAEPTPPGVVGVGEGTAIINGETYLFGDAGFPAVRCEPDMFGLFLVFLQQVDESGAEIPGGSLELTLLLEGSDPEVLGQDNTARLGIGEQDWIADEEDIPERGLEPSTSQVDTHTIDGNTVSGSATFYEEESYYATTGGSSEPVVTAQGSFEVTCSGE